MVVASSLLSTMGVFCVVLWIDIFVNSFLGVCELYPRSLSSVLLTGTNVNLLILEGKARMGAPKASDFGFW